MSTEIQPNPESRGSTAGDAGETRKTRGIRFSESEWDVVEAVAGRRGLSAAEFVRMACLDAARAANEAGAQSVKTDLAPLIERTFHYAYVLATLKRGELANDGRRKELKKLVAAMKFAGIQFPDPPLLSTLCDRMVVHAGCGLRSGITVRANGRRPHQAVEGRLVCNQ